MIHRCWILYRIVRDRVRRGWDIDSALFGSCTRPDGNFGSSAAEHCEPSRLQQAQSAHYRLREMDDVLSDREPLIEPTTGTRVGGRATPENSRHVFQHCAM